MSNAQEKQRGYEVFELTGLAMYPVVHKPHPEYAKFSVDLVLTDQDQLNRADKLGLTLKEGRYDEGPHVSISRKDTTGDGQLIRSIPVFDEAGEETKALVGNGSRVVVRFIPSSYDNKWGKGVKAVLLEMKILELIPYEGKKSK